MPFKTNSDRRHHIPKQRHKVTNWSEYDAGLRVLGSLTVWFTEGADLGLGSGATPGGQPLYSTLAITTALTLRALFRLALRQTEGLIGSILDRWLSGYCARSTRYFRTLHPSSRMPVRAYCRSVYD